MTPPQIQHFFYRVLRNIILEIRQKAHEENDKHLYALVDLIHNIPGIINTTSSITDEKLLEEHFSRFTEIYVGYEGPFQEWLENEIEISRKMHEN